MAAEPKKFVMTITGEGPNKTSLRAKFPTGAVKAMGGDPGDAIELEIQGRTIIGGRLYKGKAADAARSRAVGQSPFIKAPAAPKAQVQAPAKNVVSKGRAVAPKATATKTAKVQPKAPAKATPTNNRKTKVTYEAPKATPAAGKTLKKVVKRK